MLLWENHLYDSEVRQTDKLIFLKDITIHPPRKTYFSQQFGKTRIEKSLKNKDFSELKFVPSRLWSVRIQSHASLLSLNSTCTAFNKTLHIHYIFLKHKYPGKKKSL